MTNLRITVLSFTLAVILMTCARADENFTGSEYMPDMAHSLAVESNTYNYYSYNTWDERSEIPLADLVYPKYTVEGTVPRGYAGSYAEGMTPPPTLDDAESMRGLVVDGDHLNAIAVPTNGYVPYYYEDTPEGHAAAKADNMTNPFPITEQGLETGENLYNIFCAICHGETGNGLGYIYDTDKNPQAAYPAAPASFLRPEFLEASNQRYYYAIMNGYNVMGHYKDKMNYEERWQVIHYIRALQAKETGTEYSPEVNTLDPAVGTPVSEYDGALAVRMTDEEEPSGEAGNQLTEAVSEEAEQGDLSLRKK